MTPCHLPLPGLSGDEPCGACGHAARLHRSHREYVRPPEPPQVDARIRDLEEANAELEATVAEAREALGAVWTSKGASLAEGIRAKTRFLEGLDDVRLVFLPVDEWGEDDGDVIWWRLPVAEPPYVGTPLDDDWIDDHYTHFSRLPSNDEIERAEIAAPKPETAPTVQVGPSITREQARAALDWHKRIGGEGFGIAPEWEPVYAMLRACADSEPAPTETAPASLVERAKAYVVWVDGALGAPYESGERILRDLANATPAPTVQVGPAISRSDVREYLDGFGPGRGAVKSRVDKALRAYADGSGEEPADRWDAAIEEAAQHVTERRTDGSVIVSGTQHRMVFQHVTAEEIRALKGRGR